MTRSIHKIYVLDSGARTGLENMAWDTRCANWFNTKYKEQAFKGDIAILRFYNWSPPALSIGYNQSLDDINLKKCKESCVDVVKRPTGGRAVLHIDEITYSCLTAAEISNQAFYRDIHLAIAKGLETVGIMGRFQKSQPNFRQRYKKSESLACFTASAKEELEVLNKKLVGSAQRRFGQVLLQHGSILLSEKHKQIVNFINENDPETRARISDELASKTISLREIVGDLPSREELQKEIVRGFKQVWKAEIVELNVEEFEENFLL